MSAGTPPPRRPPRRWRRLRRSGARPRPAPAAGNHRLSAGAPPSRRRYSPFVNRLLVGDAGTGRVKAVAPPGTKAARTSWLLHRTLIIPMMSVRLASSRAGTDWLKWPPYTGRSSSCLVSAMHSEAMTPLNGPASIPGRSFPGRTDSRRRWAAGPYGARYVQRARTIPVSPSRLVRVGKASAQFRFAGRPGTPTLA